MEAYNYIVARLYTSLKKLFESGLWCYWGILQTLKQSLNSEIKRSR